MTEKVNWPLYRYWLGLDKEAAHDSTADAVIDGILDNLENNPAYQEDATRNGETQPILVSRRETNKCSVTVIPGDEMYIGDLIGVFGEFWICMEVYTDEYGVTYAELWMCNHIFCFQNNSPRILRKYAIIDDGSYSKVGEKKIAVTDYKYTCYIPLDKESECLFTDKRLSTGTSRDKDGKDILEVGKIVWLDAKTGNYGKGSHLLTFYLAGDVYSAERDDLASGVCDYIAGETSETPAPDDTVLVIEGRDTMRIGTMRTYEAAIYSEGKAIGAPADVEWSAFGLPDGVKVTYSGTRCTVFVPLSESLIGSVFEIKCADTAGEHAVAEKRVEVITIG